MPYTTKTIRSSFALLRAKVFISSFFILCLTTMFNDSYGQVECYTFQQSNGTYSPLTGATNVFSGSWDDAVSSAVPIGFTFNYNGSNYTSCYINSNGFISFGTSPANQFLPISNVDNSISAFGRDLMYGNSSSTVLRSTTGTAPNRIFVVEWRNTRRYATSWGIYYNTEDLINFQIRLYESSNVIEIIYGLNSTPETSNNLPVQVGIRGLSGDINNRSGGNNTPWNSTASGTSNNATVNFKNGLVPASGLIFSWIPVSVPTSISSSSNAVCAGETTTLTAVGESRHASTLWFEGACGNVLFSQEWSGTTMPYTHSYTTLNSISGGILNVTSQSHPDAQINMENIFATPINPAVYRNIAIRYKVVSGTGDQAEIYFKKTGLDLTEGRVVRTNLISDNSWHIANFNMSSNSNWNNNGGNITGWRFDWTRGSNVRMEIDYIALTDRPVLENTNANESVISVTPTATATNYYAMRIAESTCFSTTACATTTVYRGKTWNGGVNGNWGDPNLWIPNGVPSVDDCITIPSSFTMAIPGSHGVGRTLNISSGNLIVNSGNSITVRDAVSVAAGANLILENSASLVQRGTTNTNSGNITVRRTAKPMKRYDFTYWSSPVAGQTLYNFSPQTLRDKYYSWDITTQNWVTHLDGAQTMQAGKGYIVRAPQSFDINATQTFNSNFIGVPNNGTIPVTVSGSPTTNRYNLIGNPYPSAIDMDAFFTDTDNTELEQTIYLWTHNSPPNSATPGSSQYNYAASDYAVYNRSGGVATSPATDNPFDPVPSNNFNNALPTRHLAAGQAFFIKGLANGNVRFTNDMRVQSNNNNFYRSGNSNSEENDKSRFWLNLRNNEGAFNQTLVGYFDGATNDYDNGFDGELFGGNYVTVYSILNDKKLSIQGKGLPFSDEDVVPIGVIASISGQFSLSLDSYDGLFSRQTIFLHDKTLGTYHNLKEGGYAFSMTAGTYNDRFEIVFRNGNLSTPKFSAESIIVYKKGGKIFVDAGKTEISNLKILDISGRIIFEKQKIDETSAVIDPLSIADQVLLINIMTSEGTVTKKLIYKN